MGASQVADTVIYAAGPSLGWDPKEAFSESVAEVIDLRGVPRALPVIGPDGRKRLEYAADSFWGLPPLDLGDLRSDRLDDFLYGEP